MNNQHDLSYKLLFSEPRVVRDLLTGFVKEEWIDRLDLDSLEKVSSTFVTDDLRDREGDVIWRVRFGDEWVYVYLLSATWKLLRGLFQPCKWRGNLVFRHQ